MQSLYDMCIHDLHVCTYVWYVCIYACIHARVGHNKRDCSLSVQYVLCSTNEVRHIVACYHMRNKCVRVYIRTHTCHQKHTHTNIIPSSCFFIRFWWLKRRDEARYFFLLPHICMLCLCERFITYDRKDTVKFAFATWTAYASCQVCAFARLHMYTDHTHM